MDYVCAIRIHFIDKNISSDNIPPVIDIETVQKGNVATIVKSVCLFVCLSFYNFKAVIAMTTKLSQ